eukprot:scaffold8646_cov115-Isochrysis_galbana.AAC.5
MAAPFHRSLPNFAFRHLLSASSCYVPIGWGCLSGSRIASHTPHGPPAKKSKQARNPRGKTAIAVAAARAVAAGEYMNGKAKAKPGAQRGGLRQRPNHPLIARVRAPATAPPHPHYHDATTPPQARPYALGGAAGTRDGKLVNISKLDHG